MIAILLASAAAMSLEVQQATVPPGTEQPTEVDPAVSPIDSIVGDDLKPEAAAPRATGDPVLDRLNALEARVRQLEARNAELEQQADFNQQRLETVETRAAKNAQFGWVPSTSDSTGAFTFKPRGVVEADGAAFFERKGGYDYNNGTAFRRARLGVEGTAFKWFNYRLEVDFAGNAVNLTDAYLQYTKIPKTVLTLGQHKAPFGLESNNSDNYNTFLERGMFTNAFGNAGAERRIGLSATYGARENLNIAVGLFGDNESISRSSAAPVTDTPDESWGVNGRITWEPLLQPNRILHLGAAGYYRTALKSGDTEDAVRLTDRPNIRVDNGNIADSGVITGVRSLQYGGMEAAAVLGPLTLAGEAGRLWLVRPGLSDQHFTGFYGYASYFLTGESRPFKAGNFDRVKPFRELGKDGLGAFEVALRYDRLDLSNTPVLVRRGNDARSWTFGINWYFNPYAKLMVNYVRFRGDNTPLDPVGDETAGDVLATRLHLDF
ncbi:porin [Sphingomonas sp. BN140010]|uniref:Porin n=1 Tax=Sphingomonas arvum TaxID=2992113 RepID=A0ABT3JGE0_9SPHN|nr:porin [Sphingomonas sp. BN140010]MCW3798074.1 porin [Sphingomonas sp. BN140010]